MPNPYVNTKAAQLRMDSGRIVDLVLFSGGGVQFEIAATNPLTKASTLYRLRAIVSADDLKHWTRDRVLMIEYRSAEKPRPFRYMGWRTRERWKPVIDEITSEIVPAIAAWTSASM